MKLNNHHQAAKHFKMVKMDLKGNYFLTTDSQRKLNFSPAQVLKEIVNQKQTFYSYFKKATVRSKVEWQRDVDCCSKRVH